MGCWRILNKPLLLRLLLKASVKLELWLQKSHTALVVRRGWPRKVGAAPQVGSAKSRRGIPVGEHLQVEERKEVDLRICAVGKESYRRCSGRGSTFPAVALQRAPSGGASQLPRKGRGDELPEAGWPDRERSSLGSERQRHTRSTPTERGRTPRDGQSASGAVARLFSRTASGLKLA